MTEFSVEDEVLFDVHRIIETEGVCIEYIPGERGQPPWAYTVGLLQHAHPELIVFGLPECCAADVMTQLHDEIRTGLIRPIGRGWRQPRLEVGRRLSIRVVPVADHYWDCADEHRLCIARAYHAAMGRPRSEWKALQVVWATKSGGFPWQPGASTLDRRRQPLLDRGELHSR